MKLLPVPSGGGGSGHSFKDSKNNGSSSEFEEEEQGSTLESRQAQGYDNWKALQNQSDAKRQREAKAEAIKKARDAAQKFSKLEGKGLAEEDEGEVDTKTWLLQQKKRRKRIEKEREKAERLERELAEREAALEHTAADLEGVNVTHSLEDFEDQEHILTLKDATIDQNEEEGDELENLDMREKEALSEKLSLKKKRPAYDPHADMEDGDSKILKHYDEAIDGKKRKRFQLDGKGVSAEDREAMKNAVGAKLRSQPISLDIVKDDVPISDYADLVEAKVKKPKKKKAKTRQKAVDEDDIFPVEQMNEGQTNGDSMDVDALNGHPMLNTQKPTESASLVDDDDLEASLAIQRRAALKKRKRTKPEDIARQLRDEASATQDDTADKTEGLLLIDETTEFVANLQRGKEEEKTTKQKRLLSPTTVKEESPTQEMDVDMESIHKHHLSTQLSHEASAASKLTVNGLDDEATLSNGVGSTLSLLSQRGLIAPRREEDIVGLQRDRQRFLLEKRRRESEIERKARLQRERDRASGKFENLSAREREEYSRFENKQRDQIESRAMTDVYNQQYRPHVELQYIDDDGRKMEPKEAFRYLSHSFHGKSSGKGKLEKHIKKVEEEKKREGKSWLGAEQRENGQKMMRLA